MQTLRLGVGNLQLFIYAEALRHGNSRLRKELLGNGFVRGHRRREVITAGVIDSEKVKCRLDFTVLAVRAVQRDEYEVGLSADL